MISKNQSLAFRYASTELPTVKNYVGDLDYFKAFVGNKDGGLFIGKPIRNPQTKEWTLYLARKISNEDNSLKGVIVGAIDIAHFEDIYQLLKLDYPRPVSLYRDDGILIASFPHRENLTAQLAPELGARLPSLQPGKIQFLSHSKGNGEQEDFALGLVPKFPLFIAVTNDEYEALASWRETAFPIVLSSILVCFFIIAAAGLLIREAMRQKRLSDELGSVRGRYEHTVNSVMDAIVAIDEYENIILFNPSAEAMFGYSADEALGQSLLMLIPKRFHQGHHGHLRSMDGLGPQWQNHSPQLGILGLRSDGTEFPIETTFSKTLVDGQKQYTAVLRDATQRRKAESDLRELNTQLRGLSEALETIREQERTRIARELHDDLGQQLTGLKLELTWLSNRIKEGKLPPQERVLEMKHQLNGAIASVRRISTELRPIILDDLGFVEAVKWLLGEFTKRTNIPVNLDLQAEVCVSQTELATALFRIVQESLTNVARHAEAGQVNVTLLKDDVNLILTITDDGKGLPPDLRSGGFGLVSMPERAHSLGAKFSIQNGKLKGVAIRVEFGLDLPLFSGVVA